MGDEKNLSFVLQEANKVKYEDRPTPEIKESHDVLVQVKFTGICGSDVHYWTEGAIGDFVVKSPMVLGHESAGIVCKVGTGVTSLKPGDRVAMEPGVPCRFCVRCKDGKYNLCPDMAFAATPPYDGTLANYYVLPEDLCYVLPHTVSLEEGALIEPLAVAVHIIRQAHVKPGDMVVIFGAGPIGLLCCAVSKAFGAKTVVTVDINEERVQFAKSFAASAAWKPQKESPEDSGKRLIKECNLGFGADVVIEATGAEICIQTAVHALRVGGTLVQGGMGKPNISWPITTMTTKELNVKGSFRYASGDYALAIELVVAGKVDVKRLISKKVEFRDAEEAFADTKAAKGIKILIGGPSN